MAVASATALMNFESIMYSSCVCSQPPPERRTANRHRARAGAPALSSVRRDQARGGRKGGLPPLGGTIWSAAIPTLDAAAGRNWNPTERTSLMAMAPAQQKTIGHL